MKKIFVLAIVFVMCLTTASAALDYRLDLFSLKPLYKEYSADRELAGFNVMYGYAYEGFPEYIYQNNGKFDLGDPTKEIRNIPYFGVYRLGETLSVLKNTFTFDSFISPLSFDLSFTGSIKSVHDGEFTDQFGFDGVYFYGLSASVANKVAMRLGYSHHCTHYGDGVYFSLGEGSYVPPEVDEWFKYLKMNSVLVSLSIEPFNFLRVYGELSFNLKSTDVRPYYFSPIWARQGANAADGAPESYGARVINFGIEVQYPIFKSLGMTRLSYHGRALEEGKIVYKVEELASAGKTNPFYDPDRPWEFEHSINLSQDITPQVSFSVTWHTGRFILDSFFATRSSYITIGARFNYNGSIGLIDTAK